jgi:GNAT superfamily N-acetyltransferase
MPAARRSRPPPRSLPRVPIEEDPAREGGRILRHGSGAELARYVEAEREERRFAERFELSDGADPERVLPVVLAELGGWRVAAEEPFARRLTAAGGSPRRHAHVMSRDLVRDPAPSAWLEPQLPEGVRLMPADRPAIDLAPAYRAAYPPDHPDYENAPNPDRPEIELEQLISGRLMGPLLRCSGLAVGEEGSVLGAILVNGAPGEPPFGGPWISQIFRHPAARGVGTSLLRRALALAARDGLPALGLAVTHGNAALAVYAAHGFADVRESVTVDLP